MKIKLRRDKDRWEMTPYEGYITMPIIIGRTMIFGAYNVEFEMTANIWK